MIRQYANFVLKRRFWVISAMLLLMGILIYGALYLKFNNDYRAYFKETNPERMAHEQMQATYAKSDSILIALVPDNRNVFSLENLKAVRELTEMAWQLPFSRRVDSITNFQHSHAEDDNLIVADLVDDADLNGGQIDRIKRIALSEPVLINRLIAADSGATGINVTFEMPGESPNEVTDVAQTVRQLASEFETAHPGIKLYLTGDLMLNAAFPEASQADMTTLLPAAFVSILTIIMLVTRQITGVLVTVLIAILAIGAAVGFGGWLGLALDPASSGAVIIILTSVVANAVHVLVAWRHRLDAGMNKNEAMVDSLEFTMKAMFWTTLTTIVGFLTLNFSESPPFVNLGNISAFGVLLAFALAVTLLPAIVTAVPGKHAAKTVPHRYGILNKVAECCIGYRRTILSASLILIVVIASFIPRNELNDVFVEYFDQSTFFRSNTDAVAEHLTGIYTINIQLDSGKENGVVTTEFLKTVDAFDRWLKTQPEVINVNSVAEIFKRLNMNLHSDHPDWKRLPDSTDQAAQALLLYEMSLPYGLDLNDSINVNKQATRLIVTMRTLSTNEILAFEKRCKDWVETNASGVGYLSSSPTLMFAHIGDRQIKAMLKGTIVCLAMVSVALIILLRSVKYGLLAMVPNVIPAVIAFGLWGATVGEVGLGLSVVTAMTLGIVVDDTIHIIVTYLEARNNKGLSAEDAIRHTFSSVGVAIFTTSIALISGFLILSFSTFQINSGLGLLVSIVIATAMVADFLFFPALLLTVAGRKQRSVQLVLDRAGVEAKTP